MSKTRGAAISCFRDLGQNTDASLAHLTLLEGARTRWESVFAVHPWRLDVFTLLPRESTSQQVQAEYRVRDGEPVIIFRRGPTGSVNSAPVVTGDMCRLATAPTALDSFLLQVAVPAETS